VQYEQAIQIAFREVADALAGRSTARQPDRSDQALLEATSESTKTVGYALPRRLDSYLGVLDSQRSLIRAQQTLWA